MTASVEQLTAAIDALLPQTQCTRCGYAGCLPYAAAIAAGDAPINHCPPGGAVTIRSLAALLDQPYVTLDPLHGSEAAPQVAWIDAARCIGCARCLPPCPVDAILGASKYLHTVLAERCTGCELCVSSCPVDCIEMRPAAAAAPIAPSLNRARYLAHTRRAAARARQRQHALDAKKAAVTGERRPTGAAS